MSSKDLLAQALKLNPDEKFMMVEKLLKSLDDPDDSIDAAWNKEAEERLKAYRSGKSKGFSMEEVFKEE